MISRKWFSALIFLLLFSSRKKVRQRIRFNFTKQQNPLSSFQTKKATPYGRDKAPTMAKMRIQEPHGIGSQGGTNTEEKKQNEKVLVEVVPIKK
jgi:hypothetical protein